MDFLKKFSHVDVRTYVFLCAGFAVLLAVAVGLSEGVPAKVADRITTATQHVETLSAAMYEAVTYSGIHSYGAGNSAYSNFAAPPDTASGYPAPLGCSRVNGSLYGQVCSQADNFYNNFGVFGIYETTNPARGYFQYFTADAPAFTGNHRGWAEFWSAPNIYQKTSTGEILLTNAGRGLGSPPNEETIAAYVFNGGPSGDPGTNAPGFITPGAPSYGQFSNGRWLTINNGSPLAEDSNAFDGNLYNIVPSAPITGRPAYAPSGANPLTVPAGTNMTLEWTCQPYQIQYWSEGSCGGALGGSDCSSAKSIRLFNGVTTSGGGGIFAQTARAGAVQVRPFKSSTFNAACVSPAFSYNPGYTVAGLNYRYVIPARNSPTMSLVVTATYPTPTGSLTVSPTPPYKLPLGASPTVGGATLSWYINQNTTAMCTKVGPPAVGAYVPSGGATADPNSGVLPAQSVWKERTECGTAAAPNMPVTQNFTRPGTYTYSIMGAVLNTSNAWVYTTVDTEAISVTCGNNATWVPASNQCACNSGFLNSDGTNCTNGPVPVVTLSANPTSGSINVVNPTLTWTTTNTPSSCTATGDWAVTGAKSTTGGSQAQGVLTQAKTYSYTLTCQNASGPSLPKTATVTVSNPALPVVSLSASPAGGPINTIPKMTWSATNNPSSCTAFGDPGTWTGAQNPLGGTSVPQAALTSPGTYAYSLTCTNAGGTSLPVSKVVTICNTSETWNGTSCNSAPTSINTFSASPTRVRQGSPVNLLWDISNVPVTGCQITSTAQAKTGLSFSYDDIYPDVNGNSVVATPGVSTGTTDPPFFIYQTTVFTLSCNGTNATPVTVTVVPTIQEI
jgi:hypothetical protein